MTMADTKNVATPELDKSREWIDHKRKPNDLLTEFYDFLKAEGIVLAEWSDGEYQTMAGDPVEHLQPHRLDGRPSELFAKFAGLDLAKMDAEQAALLEAIRS